MERHAYFILLSKGYVDALAAHDTSVDQFTADTGLNSAFWNNLCNPLTWVLLLTGMTREAYIQN